MTRATKKFGTAPETEQARCIDCDPPEPLRRELGSMIGTHRHRHYLTFKSTDDLESHLRKYAWFPAPASGLNFDTWLSSVLSWHRQQRALKAEEARRWG